MWDYISMSNVSFKSPERKAACSRVPAATTLPGSMRLKCFA